MKKILSIVLVFALYFNTIPKVGWSATVTSSLPKYIDNSKTKFFPPIWNQGSQGCCAVFSTCYYQLTYMLAKANNWDVLHDTENKYKFSPKWTYNLLNCGSNISVDIEGALDSLKSIGCISLYNFPYKPLENDYKAWPTKDADWRAALNNRISNWGREVIGPEAGANTVVTGPDDVNIQKIKSRLANGEVLTFGSSTVMNYEYIYATNNPDRNILDDDSFLGKRIVHYANGQSPQSHQMTIVGYNDNVFLDYNKNGAVDQGELGVFIIANSYGTEYGDKGFIYMAYDALNAVSVHPNFPSSIARTPCMSSYYYMEVPTNSEPKIVAEVNVTAKTRDTVFEFGVTDASSTTPPTSYKQYSFPYDYHVPLSFDGTYNQSSAGFAFDITDLLAGNSTNKKVWLRVSDSSSDFQPTILNDFQIVDLITGKTIQTLGLKINADGRVSSSEPIKKTALTSLVYQNFSNTPELKTSMKTYENTLPFYMTNTENLRLTKVTVKSPSKSLDIPLSQINTQHAYNMFRGVIDFSNYNFEKGDYEIIINCLNMYNVPLEYRKTTYCIPKTPSANKNLALNKLANASVTNWYNETPDKAINGTWNDLNDKWCTGYGAGNDSWLSIDLGETVNINRWLVVHEKGANFGYDQYFTSNFKLEASYDNENWRTIDTVSNNTSGITNRYLPYTIYARYLRLEIITADIDNIARIYEFQLYYDAPISTSGNIALNKKATASVEDWSSNGMVESPAMAVNGTYAYIGDKWCTGFGKGNGSWLKLDLGNIYKINRLKVIHEKGTGFPGSQVLFTRKFSLKVSPDGVNNWRTVDTEDNTKKEAGITEKSINGIEARFVQLYITSADIDNVARIYEFQLYND